jgi:hypothetical protein
MRKIGISKQTTTGKISKKQSQDNLYSRFLLILRKPIK